MPGHILGYRLLVDLINMNRHGPNARYEMNIGTLYSVPKFDILFNQPFIP
jgi:hypothetical protein